MKSHHWLSSHFAVAFSPLPAFLVPVRVISPKSTKDISPADAGVFDLCKAIAKHDRLAFLSCTVLEAVSTALFFHFTTFRLPTKCSKASKFLVHPLLDVKKKHCFSTRRMPERTCATYGGGALVFWRGHLEVLLISVSCAFQWNVLRLDCS